ncbi:hypothetical protein NKH89_35055 [Mesorhizobium sp. M0923]|uniref:hypothetical protein n=1 Tax=Mesorhizobium sp. M0923 TaxID=2957028 RepID=UPI0033360B96
MNDYDADIINTLKSSDVRVITKASNANTIIHYLSAAPEAIASVVKALEKKFPTANIGTKKVGIVSAIGSALNFQNLTVVAAQALADACIEVLGVHQLMRNIDIIFIVDELRLDDAVDSRPRLAAQPSAGME